MLDSIRLEYRTDVPAIGLPVSCVVCKHYIKTTRRARKHGRKWIERWRCGNKDANHYLSVRHKFDTCGLGERPISE